MKGTDSRTEPQPPIATLSLRNDDPQAVEKVIHYLYHLDYPGTRAPAATNGSNGVHPPEVNGHEESVPDAASDGRTAETAEPVDGPVDESLPVATKPKGKKKKKKKATPSDAAPADAIPDAPADDVLPEKWDEAVAAEEASHHEDAESAQGSLAIHAKVYQLSKKYGIEGLEALALDKFGNEAGEQWATDDFLQATKIVYSASNPDGDDRKMKDLVTGIVYVHPELLDKAETQKVIRGLDLGYDVLMRVRKQGGFF